MFCLIFTKKKIKNLDCSRIGNMAHFLQWMTLIISFKLPFSAYLERKKIFLLNICIIDEYVIILFNFYKEKKKNFGLASD